MNELSRARETSSQIVTSIQSSMMIKWGQNAYKEGTLELVQLSASWRLRSAQARESGELASPSGASCLWVVAKAVGTESKN